MNKKELAQNIKDRVVVIGTCLKHMESISNRAKDFKTDATKQQFFDAFAILYISLQNYVYIELFKIFDTDEDAKDFNIYTLINSMDDKNKYYRMLSPYNRDIKSIKYRRNHIFAHDLGQDGTEVFKNNPVNHEFKELLQCIANVCCEANDTLFPNTHVSNASNFDKWLYMAIDSLQRCSDVNSKIAKTSFVTPQIFESHIDEYIIHLDNKLADEFDKNN